MEYNLKAIHELIEKSLTKEEFNYLVYYEFRDVHNQFTDGQQQVDRIIQLVDYANKHRRIDALLEEIKQKNLQVYEEFRPRIFKTAELNKLDDQEHQAIKQLIQYFQFLRIEELQTIYLSCRPDNAPRIVDDINEMLNQLNRILPSQKYRPIIEFVVKIKENNPDLNQLLKTWLNQFGNLFGYADFIRVANYRHIYSNPPTKSSESSLLIEINENESDRNKLQVEAWFWSSQLCRPIQEKVIVEVDNEQSELNQRYRKLSDNFTKLIRESNTLMKKIGSEDLRIEFFLPISCLIQDNFLIEWIDIDKSGIPIKICQKYPIVFRFSERRKVDYQDSKGEWKRKWQKVKSGFNDLVYGNSSAESGEPFKINSSETFCVGHHGLSSSECKRSLEFIYREAIPIFLWSRCTFQDKKLYLQEIERILNNEAVLKNFQNLPQQIKVERKKAMREEYIGHHICLLWDDPERMPPDPQTPENALMAF